MKNDMRITYPLWQMGAILLMILFTLLYGLSSYITNSILGIIFLLIIVYLVLLFWNIAKHNKRMPNQKITIFSWKPQEYMDDDELFQEITKRATKKVYSYFVWSIPLLAGLSLGLSLGTIAVIVALLLLSFGQYLIYYREIRKYMGADE
ncbi:hypothetical protein [Psychrobacillus sp.]|uniref:hypothetical protein n=1 Tax=Psychrobacillus sp. TaxID=1871623 RepID=UPI0028BDAE6E|nr:hypothetical protein [Psychrobacillus sp.]